MRVSKWWWRPFFFCRCLVQQDSLQMQAMIAIGQSSAVNYNYVNLISGCPLWWQANNRIIKTHVVTQKSNKAFTVTQYHSARSCWCDACNNDYIIKSSKRQCEKSVSLCWSGDRVDGLAAETGATVELCHVALAVRSKKLLLGCVCVYPQITPFLFLPIIFVKAAPFFSESSQCQKSLFNNFSSAPCRLHSFSWLMNGACYVYSLLICSVYTLHLRL